MSTRGRLITRVALLLALGGAITALPAGHRGAAPQLVGTAQAARAVNPFETEGAWAKFIHLIGDIGHGETGIHIPTLPKAFPRIPAGASPEARASIVHERAAIFAERLVHLLDTWTCGTAKILDEADTINGRLKLDAEQYAVNHGASPQEATGFVEQGAELGRSLLLKVVVAGCPE